jgi:RecA-family ATPase
LSVPWKIFPCKLDKTPLVAWKEQASNDPNQIAIWQKQFNGSLGYWGIPTGPENDLLVLDADVKDGGMHTIQNLHIPLTMTQRTQSGGMHFLFRYPKDGRRYGNRTKFLPGLDIRGTGGYICCYGLDQTPIAEPPPLVCEASLKAIEAPQGAPVAVQTEIALDILRDSLEAIRTAHEGQSNDTLNRESFKVGQLIAAGSVPRDYAEAALLAAARARNKPEHEAMATIASGLSGGASKPLASPFGEPVSSFPLPAAPVIAEYKPRKFTREDLLNMTKLKKPKLFDGWSSEDITITVADGGTGKTTLKLYEAICLALGDRFLGFNCVQPGKTLFFTGEDSVEKLGAMLGAILGQMGLMIETPENNAKVETVLNSIFIKKDADLCLIVKDKTSTFLHLNRLALDKVMAVVDEIKPKLVVFDPISSFWGSEAMLNDMNKAVIKFVSEIVDKHDCCVEMINHSGKQSSSSKDNSQFAGRGGTGLPSNARVSRHLRQIFEVEYFERTGEQLVERQSAMECVINKYTDGSPLYNKPFLIVRDGFLFSRKELSPAQMLQAEKALGDNERVFTFIKQAREANKYPSRHVVTGYFMAQSDPISEARVKRALNMLHYQGHMGEFITEVEGPDQTSTDKVYVLTDEHGKEL